MESQLKQARDGHLVEGFPLSSLPGGVRMGSLEDIVCLGTGPQACHALRSDSAFNSCPSSYSTHPSSGPSLS